MEKHNQKQATLFSFASIIFVEQLFRVLQGNIDVLILGKVSHDAVAAVGIINQMIAISLVIISVGPIGTNILLAQFAGERNQAKVISSLFSGLTISIWIAATLFAAIYFFHEVFLQWLGLSELLIHYGSIYIKIVSFTLLLHAFNMIFLVYLRNMRARKVIIGTLFLATAINAVGNVASMYVFETTEHIIMAVAIMTVISHLFTFFVYLYEMAIKNQIRFSFGKNRAYVKEISKTGIPSALEHFSYILFQLVLSWVIIRWGNDQLTAKTYLQSWTEFIFIFSITIGQATQILLGQTIGQNRVGELHGIVKKSVKINVLIVFLASTLLFLVSNTLFAFYSIDMQVAHYMYYLLFITIILEPLRAVNVNMVSSLYAIRDTKFPMAVSIISLWFILVPVILLFQSSIQIIFVWILMIVDELLRSIFLYKRWKAKVKVNM